MNAARPQGPPVPRPRQPAPSPDAGYADPVPVSVLIAPVSGLGIPAVLAIRRAIEPGLGAWALPGGYAMQGESLEHAALRETFEETGIWVEVQSLRLLHSAPADHGRLLAFVLAAPVPARRVAKAVPSGEVFEVAAQPLDDFISCFPLHAEAVARHAALIREALVQASGV